VSKVTRLEIFGTAATFLIIVGVFSAVAYGGWRLQRWYHYKFGYESQVSETVRELVKPECLK
jgi:hypothetical protein